MSGHSQRLVAALDTGGAIRGQVRADLYMGRDQNGHYNNSTDARVAINRSRLQVMHAAWLLDTQGLAGARSAVSEIMTEGARLEADAADREAKILQIVERKFGS